MDQVTELSTDFQPLRALHRVTADLNTARDLEATLRALVDGVVDGLGFRCAAVSVVQPDGTMRIAAVAGVGRAEAHGLVPGLSEDCAPAVVPLAAAAIGASAAQALAGAALTTGQATAAVLPAEPAPVPAACPITHPEWSHRPDSIHVQLRTPEGELVGMLGVGLPVDSHVRAALRRELLDMVTVQAAIAIGNARHRHDLTGALQRLQREERVWRTSGKSFRQAFENAPTGMAMTALRGPRRGRLLQVNEALGRLVGRPTRALRGSCLLPLAHAEDRALMARHITRPGTAELRLMHADGTARWVSLRASVVLDAAGLPDFLLTHLDDADERKRREELLTYQASHDPLTGLANAAELRARLDAALGMGCRPAVFFCDLDRFKHVNDRYGHDVGDAVLIEVGHRLAGAVRDGDTVARVGGDEFVVLAAGLDGREAEELAARLRAVFVQPVRHGGRLIPIGASIGIGLAEAGMGAAELLREADQRMYAAKQRRVRVVRVC